MHIKSRGSDKLRVDYHWEVREKSDIKQVIPFSMFFSLLLWVCEWISVTETGSSQIWSKIAEAFLKLFLAVERDSSSLLFSAAARAFRDTYQTNPSVSLFHQHTSLDIAIMFQANVAFANPSHAVAKISSGLCLSSFALHLHFDNREVIHHEFIITIS